MVNKNNEEMLHTGAAAPADHEALLEEVRQCFQERRGHIRNTIPGNSEFACGMDFDSIRAKRRAKAVVDIMDAAKKLVSEICPDIPGVFSFEEDRLDHNLMPVTAYDYLESKSFVTLACALHALDELRKLGVSLDGDHGLPPLAKMREEISTPAAWDAVHDTDSVTAMVWIIQHRNDDCTGMTPELEDWLPKRVFIDQYTASGNLDQPCVSRRRFEKIMDQISRESIEQAIALYKATFEDVLERIYRSRAVIAQKYLIHIEQGGDAGEYHMELLKFRDMLGSICVTPPEVLAHRVGPDVAEIWEDFEIPDPYTLCFAFLYLLEICDDMPWVYSVSLPLMEMCASVLPWGNEQLNDDGDSKLDHYLEDTELAEVLEPGDWYSMNYENVDEMDMDYRCSCNLAQMVYWTTEGILPRYTEMVRANPDADELFGDTALRDLNPHTYWMRILEFSRYEHPVFHFSKQEDPSQDAGPMVLEDDKFDEDEDLGYIKEELAVTTREAVLYRRELASMRNLVFALQNGDYKEEPTKLDIQYPYTVRKRIAVYGGDESWTEELKTMVKNVTFIDFSSEPDVKPLYNCDAIWIQSSKMSRVVYFRLVELERLYEIPLRYFSYASAAKCVEQLANFDTEL